jgi:hypothetical protein
MPELNRRGNLGYLFVGSEGGGKAAAIAAQLAIAS